MQHTPSRSNRPTTLLIFLLSVLCASFASVAHGRELVHVVREGQNLGMIARRYHTTPDAIAKRNRLKRGALLRLGQKLRVVEVEEHRKWRAFWEARSGAKPKRTVEPAKKGPSKKRKANKPAAKKAAAKKASAKKAAAKKASAKKAAAKKASAKKAEPKKASAKKVQPSKRGAAASKQGTGSSGRRGAKQAPTPLTKKPTPEKPVVRHQDWAREAKRPGHVVMVRYGSKVRGPLLNDKGRVVAKTAQKVDHLLRSLRKREEKRIDRRLLQRLAEVSDYFGGRTITVVSGYRPYSSKQFTRNSRHNHGKAIDFRITGVPVEALFNYCLTLKNVGCGHYPNSDFVHLDVRTVKTDWTDYSLPGKPPRYAKRRRNKSR